MKALEMHLGIDLLPTYYFDRFYYEGQMLEKHTDRVACEISVSVQVSSNSNRPWEFWFDTPNGVKSHHDGSPVMITMDLQFLETEMITKDHINEGF